MDIQDDFSLLYKVGEISQVITNILNNAKDALVENNIEDKNIIITTISTKDADILTIEDNAGGIPKEVLPKIFEPYFTTKFRSDGTGIGLHMCYNIINSINGSIIATNTNTNIGAKFTIRFEK